MPTPGLGNSTYLVGGGDRAVAIDVPRDAWRVREDCRRARLAHHPCARDPRPQRLPLRCAQLAALDGSTVVAPANGGYTFARGRGRGLRAGARRRWLGRWATPGHTPERLELGLQDGGGKPTALFSGGSLLIGGVGRADLLGHARADEMTAQQFRTMRRLAELPDDVIVIPRMGPDRSVSRVRRHRRARHHRRAQALESGVRGA